MKITTVGIDLAKNVFQIHAVNERFFLCTAPSVHSMLKTLEHLDFIRRQPGLARSTQLLVPPEQLPVLYPPATPP